MKDLTIDLGAETKLEFLWIEALKGWAGKYVATNDEYRRFKPAHSSGEYRGRTLNGDRQPVGMVSYDDAVEYADWMNRTATLPEGHKCRLPDGSEWTTLAQCGDGRKYPWGDKWPPPKDRNYADQTAKRAFNWPWGIAEQDDGFEVSCPVEMSGRNDWGLYGVGGNVWEWTRELHPGTRDWRILRGASWYDDLPESLECAYRIPFPASHRCLNFSFRLLLSR